MENQKRSKKALKSLINDSVREAISHLQLPEPTKKMKKMMSRTSKKLAKAYAEIIKKEEKSRKKADKMMEVVVNGDGQKKKKKHDHNDYIEPVKL